MPIINKQPALPSGSGVIWTEKAFRQAKVLAKGRICAMAMEGTKAERSLELTEEERWLNVSFLGCLSGELSPPKETARRHQSSRIAPQQLHLLDRASSRPNTAGSYDDSFGTLIFGT